MSSACCLFLEGLPAIFSIGECGTTVQFSVTLRLKSWKAEVVFNLTYASHQVIKGVSWTTVNQNCAWVVLKLGGMALNEKKKKKTADGYSEKTKHCNRICLLWMCHHKRPHSCGVRSIFFYAQSTRLRSTVAACVLVTVCSTAVHRSAGH